MITKSYSFGGRLQYFILLIGALLITHMGVYAQKQIKITDKHSGTPISHVNYQYGEEKGVCDENGFIRINPVKNQTLKLSHIQYGYQLFSEKELAKALNSGLLEIEQKSYLLMPVNYLQIHPNAGEKEQLTFQVQEKLAHDAGHLLEQFSSISAIRKSGAYGFDPVLRGYKYDQLNLVIDGSQCASAACPNRMDPASSQVPVNMIVQAEVLKGPHSLRFGNAFGGTINFKSADVHFSEEAEVTGRISSSYETNGELFRNEGLVSVSNSFANLKLFGSVSTGNDYEDGEGFKIPANFSRNNFGGKLGLKLTKNQTISLLAANNFAKDVDFPALPMDLREDDTWLININHSADFFNRKLAKWETSFYTTQVNHLMDNLGKMMNPRMADAVTDAETENIGGRTELHFNFEDDWLYVGSDLRIENAKGERTRTMLMGPMAGKVMVDNVWQNAQISRTGLFAEYHLQKPGFHIIFSGRLDYNHATADKPAAGFESMYEDLSSEYLNPSFSVGGTKTISNSSSLGLWFGSAQRSPGIAERFINYFPIGLDPYELIGDPNLDPETNNQVDIIFNYQKESTHVNINLFSSFLRNYISSEIREDLQPRMGTSPGVRQFINLDKALIAGFEASWRQKLFTNINQVFELAYTYGKDNDNDEALPEIPPMQLKYSLLGSFIQNKLNAELNLRNSFKQNRIANSFGETKTPAFQVVDIDVSYRFNKWGTFSTGVQNLFDEAYYEHLARSVRGANARPIYSPGRSFYFTLAIDLL